MFLFPVPAVHPPSNLPDKVFDEQGRPQNHYDAHGRRVSSGTVNLGSMYIPYPPRTCRHGWSMESIACADESAQQLGFEVLVFGAPTPQKDARGCVPRTGWFVLISPCDWHGKGFAGATFSPHAAAVRRTTAVASECSS